MHKLQGVYLNRTDSLVKWIFPSIKDILFLAYLFTPLMASSSACLGDSDTGWHIRNGEHILRNLSLPRSDYFSYTAYGTPWFAWEWLADVIMGIIHKYAGLNGIVLWANVMFAVTFTLLFVWALKKGGNVFFSIVLSGLAGFAASIHWLARPHLFTMLLLLIWYMLLERFEHENDRKSLYFLPPLLLIWTNLHAGFVVGLIVMFIYVLGNILRGLTSSDYNNQIKARSRAITLAKVFLICLVVSCLNPYGVKLHTHIVESYISSNHLMDNITEFRSPSFHVGVVKFFELLILVAMVVASISIRRFSFVEIGLVIFWTHMALLSARHIPLYALIVVPILVRHLTEFLEKIESVNNVQEWIYKLCRSFRVYSKNITGFENQFKGMIYPILAITFLVIVSLNKGELWGTQILNNNFDRGKFPIAVAEFIDRHKMDGNLFTTDQWGGYLIYRFYPRYPVFFDGRSDMYGEKLMKDYLKLVNLEYDWKGVLEKFNITWMLLPFDVPLPAAMKELPGWTVVYDDHRAIIFVKSCK